MHINIFVHVGVAVGKAWTYKEIKHISVNTLRIITGSFFISKESTHRD